MAATGITMTVYASEDAHSSVVKAVRLAGFGQDNLRLVPVDPTTRALRPDALAAMIEADLARGRRPAAVVATVGTTATTAIDPVASILETVEEVSERAPGVAISGLGSPWVHVDAALAGSAMLVPECRRLWAGVEGADSLCWNPHKWLGTVLDCSLFHVRDVDLLTRVCGSDASYLRSTTDGAVTQYRDWGLPLGRRFRALKVWFHLRLDGAEKLRERILRDLDLAQRLATAVEATPGWEVVAPVVLQTVCVRHHPPGAGGGPLDGDALDAHTLAWVQRVNDSGRAYLTPAQVDGRWLARISIGSETTSVADVEETWALIQDCATHTRPAG